MTSEKLKAMPFGKVYPCLVAKAERKGRSREEVDTLTSRSEERRVGKECALYV